MYIVCKDLMRVFYQLFFSKGVSNTYKNNRNYNSYKCSYKCAFILFLYFPRNLKARIKFSSSWPVANEKYFYFCLFVCLFVLFTFYFKVMPDSINIYRSIFLHVIPACSFMGTSKLFSMLIIA